MRTALLAVAALLAIAAILAVASVLLASSGSDELAEMKDFVRESERGLRSPKIEPLPVPGKVEPSRYAAATLSDPFFPERRGSSAVPLARSAALPDPIKAATEPRTAPKDDRTGPALLKERKLAPPPPPEASPWYALEGGGPVVVVLLAIAVLIGALLFLVSRRRRNPSVASTQDP